MTERLVHSDEQMPLLRPDNAQDDAPMHPRKQIGWISATFIIFNRIVGAGIFATPSAILRFSGSVGVSLFMWVLGGIFAAAGMYVYIIWGSALPRNGAEKNYLEHLLSKPPYLITCMFAAQAILLIWAAGSAQIFAEYFLRAVGLTSPTTVKIFAFAGVIFATVLHGSSVTWGLRLQNTLGILKLAILTFVIITGLVAASGHLQPGVEQPNNFEDPFSGTSHSLSSLCYGLFNVIYSFHGYSNANYALGEVKRPQRTIRLAGFTAVLLITAFYILVILSYLVGVSKTDIVNSGQLVAALLFKNVYGPSADRFLSACIALSALGGVLGITFSQGRVNQALGKEGILPFSRFFASSKPFGAPLNGMCLHCFTCFIIIFLLPPGDAYQFILNCSQYPVAIINCIITIGLLVLLNTTPPNPEDPDENPQSLSFSQYRTIPLMAACLLFLIINIFLVIVPLTKPPDASHQPYKHLPYWLHSIAAWIVLLIGALYWASWAKVWPFIKGYKLEAVKVIEKDGEERTRFLKVPIS